MGAIKKLKQLKRRLSRLRGQEVVVYVDGGVCQDVLYVDKKKPLQKWKPADYTLIDFDIEGSDESQVCTGCMYSPDPHGDSCGRVQAKEVKP
jgi:hypothetical protein